MRKKATMNLQSGVFNDDFNGFSIYIGSKNVHDNTISDVLIYDQNVSSKYSMISAKKGKMIQSNDGNSLALKLFDGTRYEEINQNSKRRAYSRTSFKEFTKIFDLSEFDLKQRNEKNLKVNPQALNQSQLLLGIDSLHMLLKNQLIKYQETSKQFYFLNTHKQIISHEVLPISGLPHKKQKSILRNAKANTNKLIRNARNTKNRFVSLKKIKSKYIYSFHSKMSLAIICIVFIFIGAPLGAIIKKGGFGFPVLISIFFFVIYIMMTIYFKKRIDADMLNPEIASWLPVIILGVIGILISTEAMRKA